MNKTKEEERKRERERATDELGWARMNETKEEARKKRDCSQQPVK